MIALNAVKSELFGEGGGAEVAVVGVARRARRARSAPTRGYSVWNDLRERQDPETPVSIPGNFPYAPLPADRTGNRSSTTARSSRCPTPGAAAAGAAARAAPHASNVLMVAGKRSRTGHPLFVGGPQIGYFYPGLTLEMDLHGPGWNARGATSAPFPGYILIGRREDFVWTLTSAGADIVDNYVETLCDGSDTKYLYKGKCRSMTPFNAGTIGGQPVTFNRTVHGPVTGYATVDGTRVAISRKRSSYLLRRRGPAPLPAAHARQDPRTRAPSSRPRRSRRRRSTRSTRTATRSRRSPPGVCRFGPRAWTRACPTDGRGNYEWKGLLPAKDHPHAIVRSGVLNNWNNKPARGFPAADDQWSYGSIQRVDLLNRNTNKHKRNTLATLTGAMNAAATQDVRAITFVPILSEVLRGSPAPSAREHAHAGAARGLARQGRQPARPRPGRQDRRPGRGRARHGLAAAGRCRDDAGARAVARRPAQRHAAPPLRPAARRPVRRLAHVHEQGPAHAARASR